MSEIFKEPNKIVKEKKRTYFRILGVVPSPINADVVIGYAILDMQGDRKKYQLRVYGEKQAYALVQRYKFDNATIQEGKIVNTESTQSVKLIKSDEKGHSEFNTKKMMLFNEKGQVIGNPCLVILGGILDKKDITSGKKPDGYRVIDFNGNVVDLKEKDLLELVHKKKLDIQNAKIIGKGTSEATLSAIKDEFPLITKEEVNKLKREYKVSDENKKKYLEKLKSKARHLMFSSLGADNSFWTDKNLNIYIKEHVKIKYPSILKSALEVCEDKNSIDTKLRILLACVMFEVFVEGTYKNLRNTRFRNMRNLENVGFFVKDNILLKIFGRLKVQDVEKMLLLIAIEYRYMKEAEKFVTSPIVYLPGGRNGTGARPYIRYSNYIIGNIAKKGNKGEEYDAFNIYNSIGDKLIRDYLSELPIIFTMKSRRFNAKLSNISGENIINLNMTTNKGIKEIGYTLKELEQGVCCAENLLYGPDAPLRYALSDIDISKEELKNITKRTTCLGDLLITRKLLLIEQKKYTDYETNALHTLDINDERKMCVAKESLMIILAIYNLELAEYLNEKYNIVDLDLNAIGHEAFNLDENDKIFYQTGCKFNRTQIKRNMSWSDAKISEMPDGLRGAISLNTSIELDRRLEEVLDILYQDLSY